MRIKHAILVGSTARPGFPPDGRRRWPGHSDAPKTTEQPASSPPQAPNKRCPTERGSRSRVRN